jgi:HPt (histidine-containing phosphotransfer) domain-containing protein
MCFSPSAEGQSEEKTMSDAKVNSAIEQLRNRYAANLPSKVSRAAESVSAALAGPWNPALGDIAHRLVHSLIGSSGTYGFHEFSRIARTAETILREAMETGTTPPPEAVLRLQEVVARLGFMAVTAADDAVARVA